MLLLVLSVTALERKAALGPHLQEKRGRTKREKKDRESLGWKYYRVKR